MSNLLSQASLVMIPSGYKEDVVYSQIPTNGNGDLTFTRASNGTRINSAGLVEVCPWNLVSYSNTFSDSSWVKSSCTLTSGQNDPNGGTNGWRYLSSVAATGYAYQNGVLQNGVQYTFYIYAKSNTGSNQTMYFTANSGSFTSPAFTLTSSWQLCSWTFTANSTGNNILFGYNPSATLDLLVYGAQLNIGSTAKPYFPTTDRLNVPRLTYQNGGGGCPSLLLEKQSTNLTLYSDQLDNAVHTLLNVTITANNTTSPDGTQNADKITETTGTGEHIVYDIDSNATGTYTLSAFFKGGDGTIYPVLRLNGSNTTAYAGCIFNTSTGAVVNTFYNTYSAPITKVENMGNGWYRVSMTTTTTDANFGMRIAASNSTSPSVGAYGAISYTGSTSNYFYVWGAQLEASSYPTSYIPTTSSSATRVADACFKTGISSLIGQTEGTMFIDTYLPNGTNPILMQIVDTTNSYINSLYIEYNKSSDAILANIWSSGALQIQFAKYTVTVGQRYKIALAYKANNFAFYINGTQIGVSSSGAVQTSLSNLFLGCLAGATGNDVFTGLNANQAVLFPTRLTNAELASLSTI